MALGRELLHQHLQRWTNSWAWDSSPRPRPLNEQRAPGRCGEWPLREEGLRHCTPTPGGREGRGGQGGGPETLHPGPRGEGGEEGEAGPAGPQAREAGRGSRSPSPPVSGSFLCPTFMAPARLPPSLGSGPHLCSLSFPPFPFLTTSS